MLNIIFLRIICFYCFLLSKLYCRDGPAPDPQCIVPQAYVYILKTSCAEGQHSMPRPCKLTLWHFDLKVVSESRVTWTTSVPILVFLGLSVLDLAQCTRQTDVRQTLHAHHRLMPLMGAGHNLVLRLTS